MRTIYEYLTTPYVLLEVRPYPRSNDLCLAIQTLSEENRYQFFPQFSEADQKALKTIPHSYMAPRHGSGADIGSAEFRSNIVTDTLESIMKEMARCLNVPIDTIEYRRADPASTEQDFHVDKIDTAENGKRVSVSFLGDPTIFIPSDDPVNKMEVQNEYIVDRRIKEEYEDIILNKRYEMAIPGDAAVFLTGSKGAIHSGAIRDKGSPADKRLVYLVTCGRECMNLIQARELEASVQKIATDTYNRIHEHNAETQAILPATTQVPLANNGLIADGGIAQISAGAEVLSAKVPLSPLPELSAQAALGAVLYKMGSDAYKSIKNYLSQDKPPIAVSAELAEVNNEIHKRIVRLTKIPGLCDELAQVSSPESARLIDEFTKIGAESKALMEEYYKLKNPSEQDLAPLYKQAKKLNKALQEKLKEATTTIPELMPKKAMPQVAQDQVREMNLPKGMVIPGAGQTSALPVGDNPLGRLPGNKR